jgi:hypothetical protein
MKSNPIRHLPRRLLIAASIGLIGSICLGQSDQPPSDPAPPFMLNDQSPTAAMTFADGRSLAIRSRKGRFSLVASKAGEVVNIQVRVSPAATGFTSAQCLDGGTLSAGAENIALDVDGAGSFQFQAGAKPGLYRVSLNYTSTITILQFWVADPNNPSGNPTALQGQ